MIVGAHHYIDSSTVDALAELQKLGGARVILATAPSAKAISDVVSGLGVNGDLLIAAVANDPLTVSVMPLLAGRRQISSWYSGIARDSQEAEFYLRVFSGQGLSNADTTGSGTPGVVTANGNQVSFRNPFLSFIARQLASDELAHVRALRTTIPELGGTPVARPTIDLDGAWQAFASGAGLHRPFRPLESETDFLLAAFYFEENDVPALRGVASLLQSATVKDAITGTLGDEGYHGGFLRLAISEIGLVERGVLQDAERIQSYRNQLIANPADELPGLFDQSGNPLLAPVNALGQTPTQTAREHLNLLYLNRNATAGGFFPNGLNGAIR